MTTEKSLIYMGGDRQDDSALICIPQAGAGVMSFSQWPPALKGISSVWAACMPGREARILDKPLTTIESMADELLEPAMSLPARDVVLFGHCSGAMVAYELAHRLARKATAGAASGSW